MPTLKPVDVTGLQKAAAQYDRTLRMLPAFMMEEAIKTLRLNVRQVPAKQVLTHVRRRAGGTHAYAPGNNISNFESILSYEHSELMVHETVFNMKDNIHNYDDVDVQYLGGKPVDDVAKRHPLEFQILKAMVKSHAEDVMFSMFHAERVDNGSTPLSAFNGFFTQVDALITDGKVTAARGNYAPTGAFEAPVDSDDYAAYENLCAFIGGAHPMLRSSIGGTPLLYVTETVLLNVRAALRNKLKVLEYPTMAEVLKYVREDSLCPSLEFVTHLALGTGHRVMLIKSGLLDFGWNTQQATSFVQVRDPYEDPNEVQFWLQAAYGTRIQDWHEKVFRINDQINSSLDLSGDYCQSGSVKVNITGPASAKWYLDGNASKRLSGQMLLGIAPGTYTVKFDSVDGYSTPADISITVKAGEDTVKSADYTAVTIDAGSGSGSSSAPAATVEAPTISGNETFDETVEVTITGPDGADIYYTTDGSTPTSGSTAYSEALTLSATTTLKAIAIKGGVSSDVTSKTFTKN